ncbi:uncharacterized protein LAESUDRAFT_655080, partial [Laetiporus sulphureus 93-53]
LSPFRFNVYSIFMPDLLHEFELGIWKASFTHLLRILYRQVPSFGRDTIQHFSNNASGMKKLAA